jgi:hypothetical protein
MLVDFTGLVGQENQCLFLPWDGVGFSEGLETRPVVLPQLGRGVEGLELLVDSMGTEWNVFELSF